MLEAFRQHHEYPSFRDRLTLIPIPYLKQVSAEQSIYELQLVPNVDRHVAPHAVMAAAKWAVLTRLHKPSKKSYRKALHTVIENLTVSEKCDLYERGMVPERFGDDEAAMLRDALPDMLTEDEATWSYEGRFGASPRLIRQVLLNASLSEAYTCLSPFAVLDGLDDLCSLVKEHPFLERKVQTGGYQDHKAFVEYIRAQVLDEIESDVRSASGLVEESKYMDLMTKYVNHVSQLVKGEKVLSGTTGDYEDPDQKMMESIEEKLGVDGDKGEFRNGIISRIAAWTIDNPKKKMDIEKIFPNYFNSLKDSYFEEHRKKVAAIGRFAFNTLNDEDQHFGDEDRKAGQELITGLVDSYGYCEECVKVGLAQLFSERFKNQS
jgi:predicted Ser/Thr protein kinase